MTLDILYIISTYLNDEDYMYGFSILSREQIFQSRREKINHNKCSKLLYNRLDKIINMNFVDHETRIITELLVTESMSYSELLKEFIDTLLNTKKYYNKKMLHSMKRPIYISTNNHKKGEFRYIPCCSIYRVPYSKRKYIISQTPYAKALIY